MQQSVIVGRVCWSETWLYENGELRAFIDNARLTPAFFRIETSTARFREIARLFPDALTPRIGPPHRCAHRSATIAGVRKSPSALPCRTDTRSEPGGSEEAVGRAAASGFWRIGIYRRTSKCGSGLSQVRPLDRYPRFPRI